MSIASDLQRVVDDAYGVFSKYAIGARLTVCHCNVCMAEETEFALLRTPLREIPAGLMAEYTNSAHGYEEGPIANELRYFLPRYFELIALNQPPDYSGIEQCLNRLGESSYREKWPAAEAEVIDRFFDVFVRASTARLELEEWPDECLLAFDLGDALAMALTAGADVDRLIASLDRAPDPDASIHFAALRRNVVSDGTGHTYRSAYLETEKYRPAARRLGEWLASGAVSERINASFCTVKDLRFQKILEKALWC